MNLRDYAKPYDWQGVRLWLLSYRTLAVDIAIRQLETLAPHFEYVNSATGEHSASKPEALVEAEKQAEARAKVTRKAETPVTDWQQVDSWDTRMNTFVGVLPLLVAVDWPETLTAEMAAFKAFYEGRYANHAERWQTFAALIGTETSNALWDGLIATRDNPAPGVPELGEVNAPEDFLHASAGAPPIEATTPS